MPANGILVLIASASNEGSGEPVQTRAPAAPIHKIPVADRIQGGGGLGSFEPLPRLPF